MKITLLVGLPGSGKTHLGEKMESQGAFYIDDISVDSQGLYHLKNALGAEHIVISDVFLCREKDRVAAEKIINNFCKEKGCNYDVEWIYFENNPDKCLKNSTYRAKIENGRDTSWRLIEQLTKVYKIPDECIPRIVWDVDSQSGFEVV